MSLYVDPPLRHRGSERDHRARRRDREFVEEETCSNGNQQLIHRRRDTGVDSVEEVYHFPPPIYGRRTRSAGRDRSYDNDFVEVRGTGFYSIKRPHRAYDDTCERALRRYSSSSSSSSEPEERRKSLGGRVATALGLGGAAAALASHRSRSRSRSRSRHHSSHKTHHHHSSHHTYNPSSSRSRSRDAKITQALKAAVTAGAVEAFRARKEPGGLSGPKGERILTAAITAAGIDGVIDRDPDKHEKRHIVESALAGLAANRVINGPPRR